MSVLLRQSRYLRRVRITEVTLLFGELDKNLKYYFSAEIVYGDSIA